MRWIMIYHRMTGNLLWKCQSLKSLCAEQCVVPHNRNAADAMTKFKGAHSEPLFTLLRTGMCTLEGEKSELADRATLRQTGTAPRHKVSAARSVTERTFFCSYAIGLRGSLSRVREGGAM